MIFGILFTFAIAIFGYIFAQVPGINRIGPLATAIILAIIYSKYGDIHIDYRKG